MTMCRRECRRTKDTVAIHHYHHTWGSPASRLRRVFVSHTCRYCQSFRIWPVVDADTACTRHQAVSHHPRILIVCAGLRIGGVERSLLGLLGAMIPEKCDLELFLHSHDGEVHVTDSLLGSVAVS